MSRIQSGEDRLVSHARSLVNPLNFLLATRDTGYKTTALVMAELVDNSIQAGARNIAIEVSSGADRRMPIEIAVTDDGEGMDAGTLAGALMFGGSSRFNDRSSLGRYGMGLPNGPLSRGRRVEVYSWRGTECLRSVLDLDQVIDLGAEALPDVQAVAHPSGVTTECGTLVRLLRCDRVEYRRPAALARKLEGELARIYRHFLVSGVGLSINGREISACDPLCLLDGSAWTGGRQFGDTLLYQIPGVSGKGVISVVFSELPVDRWYDLPADEKKSRAITNAPCVSIVRAGREIDRGWFFMGRKRRENYDDWWRCEVSFEPVLDELFGITNSKQAISPSGELVDTLGPDLEPIARALNNRVRKQFEMVRAVVPLGAAEKQAGRVDGALPPLPRRKDPVPTNVQQLLAASGHRKAAASGPYQIVVTDLPDTQAFDIVVRSGQLLLLLNSRHPLYRDLYGPLAMSELPRDQEVAKQVALTVLAAARAEVGTWRGAGRINGRSFRQTWADVLATFMTG